MGTVRIHLLQANEEPPAGDEISAVFLVAFRGGRMLAVRNERGWDLPGGHVEPGEDLMIALRREVREEAGAMFNNATAYAPVHRRLAVDARFHCELPRR